MLSLCQRGNQRNGSGVLYMKTPLTMASLIKRTPPMLLVAGIYLALLAFALLAVSIRM